MNHKSFQLSSRISVLLFLQIDDNSYSKVKIHGYWTDRAGEFHFQVETLNFESLQSAQDYIYNFSETSALEWFENYVPEDEE